MKWSAKKILLITGATLGSLLLLICLSLVIISFYFGDDVKKIMIAEMNKQLATEVSVNGAIEFSVFRNFPYASVSFNDVQVKETLPQKNDFLTAKKISVLFNFW